MVFHVFGQVPALLGTSAVAASLICSGIAVGIALARRRGSKATASQDDVQRLLSVLTHVVSWTHEMADDMSEYRSVVSGVSSLFRNNDEPLDEQKRMATVGLLSQIVNANEQLQNRLNHAELMLKEQAGEISTYMSEARTDALTSLPNRRALDENLSQRVCEWRRHGRPLSLLMADIDHFKKFNDTYGHHVGDAVLRQVADLLRQTTRESDLVGRFGGEEMAIVLAGTDIDEACVTAERVRRAIDDAILTYEGQSLLVTVSVGAAQCLQNESAEGVIRRADEALYAAKQAGRNLAFWHDGQSCHGVGAWPDRSEIEAEAGKSGDGTTEASSCSAESFAEICEDLRQRLQKVTSSSPIEKP